MAHIYRDAFCERIPRILVTPAERAWLNNERLRALREAPVVSLTGHNQWAGFGKSFVAWLYVLKRDRDGSLIAVVKVSTSKREKGYMRSIRCPSGLGSVKKRSVGLRRAVTPL